MQINLDLIWQLSLVQNYYLNEFRKFKLLIPVKILPIICILTFSSYKLNIIRKQ